MKKRYYSEVNSTQVKMEDWDAVKPTMPEGDLGDSREGIDEQIRKDNVHKTKIKPRRA